MISKKANLHPSVKIGHGSIIHDNVTIGENSVIEEYCIIGYPASNSFKGKPVVISENSVVRSHSVVYEGSTFGAELKVGHHSMLREGIEAGKSFQVGSFNDLEGDCTIGDYVRFHSNVHIGRGAKIGNYVWIFPYAVLTNDPIPPSGLKEGVTVEDGAVICTSAVILPGTTIGKGAFVAAMSRAKGVVPPASLIVGFDGTNVGNISKLKHKLSGKQHPWMSHFSGYYPNESQNDIAQLHKDILEVINR